MCGRFAFNIDAALLKKYFGLTKLPNIKISYNIAPTQTINVITGDTTRQHKEMRWGLIPPWSKDDSMACKMINARSETIKEKLSFRQAYKQRRCIIPASGFFEWQAGTSGKTPHYITMHSDEPMAMGGLYETWLNSETNQSVATCTILTTNANKLISPLHHRMPIILEKNDYAQWLDCTSQTTANVDTILKPIPPEKIKIHRVSNKINATKHNSPDCITEDKTTPPAQQSFDF